MKISPDSQNQDARRNIKSMSKFGTLRKPQSSGCYEMNNMIGNRC